MDYSATRKYEGTGLGLSISKAYIKLLGGKIWIESSPVKGTVVYFTITYTQTWQQHKIQIEMT